MIYSCYLEVELVDTTHVPASDLQGPDPLDPWSADADVEESARIGLRNREACQRLVAILPGAQPANDVEEFDAYLDDELPQEAVLRRLHRSRAVKAAWREGQIVIRLFDRVTWISLQVVDLKRTERPAFGRDLSRLLSQISAITGMQPRDILTGNLASAPQVTESLLKKNARALDRLSGHATRYRWLQRLGPASLVVLVLITLGLSTGIVMSAIERGNLMLHVDPTSPRTFVTDRLPPPVYRWGIMPSFFLEGRVGAEGQWARLPVYRNEYLRAGPGAPFTVLPTYRDHTPYVLRSDFETSGPTFRVGASGMEAFAAIALLPPLLLYWTVVRPILKSPPGLRADRLVRATRVLSGVLVIIGAFCLAVWTQTRL